MCNLRHAFDAQSLNGLAMKIMKGTYPPTTPFYSKSLRDLISKMLSVNPSQRPSLLDILNISFIRRHVVLYMRECFNPSNECQDLDDLNIDSLKDQAEKFGLMPLINGESKLPQPMQRNPQIIEAKLKKEEAEKQQMEEELTKLATQQKEIKNKLIVSKEKKIQQDNKANDLEKVQKQKMLDAEKRRENILLEKKRKAQMHGKKIQDTEESKDESSEEAYTARERVLQLKEKKKKEEQERVVAQLREIHHQNNLLRKKASKLQLAQFRTSSILQSVLIQKNSEVNSQDEGESPGELNEIEEDIDSEEDHKDEFIDKGHELIAKDDELIEIEQKLSDMTEKIHAKTIRIDELRESLKFVYAANNITQEDEEEEIHEVETPLPGLLDSVEEVPDEEELKEEPPTWHSKIRDRIKLLRQ